MRFTVADVERFKQLLKNYEPTLYECMPPSDQSLLSPQDAFYTLYFVHEFDVFLEALEKRNEHMARYVLTSTGELCFGHEGDPGKTIAEHWQMVGDDSHVIAAGNFFVSNKKITGLSDQSSSTTGLISLFHTLRALHNHHLPLAPDLELIESVTDNNDEIISANTYAITRETLRNILNQHAVFEYDLDEELLADDDRFEDDLQARKRIRPPTPHPFGFFYDKTRERVNISQEQPQSHELADVPGTKTTKVVVRTW